ncbi:MAG: hypothetical protein ACTS8H_02460 [Arsenophonus sp. NC-PE1-MAG3]
MIDSGGGEPLVSENPDSTNKVIDVFVGKVIRINIPAVIKKLEKKREELLEFYVFP